MTVSLRFVATTASSSARFLKLASLRTNVRPKDKASLRDVHINDTIRLYFVWL